MMKLLFFLILNIGLSFSSSLASDWPDKNLAERFGELALSCVHREYPNKIAHVLNSDLDVHPPRELTPVFYGCFDWHSAVHGHWLLAKVARSLPDEEIGKKAMKALNHSFTSDGFVKESDYLLGKGRVSFERPYGLAWLLQLSTEIREWGKPQSEAWRNFLEPLERIPALKSTARSHRVSGLAAVSGEHYEGSHWLGSFAVYLVSGRGLK